MAEGSASQCKNCNGSADSYRILVLSDIFGGTPAFSKDNFIGLAEYFRSNSERKPNMVVIFGGLAGLIPWIPQYEHGDQLKSITEGINYMSNVSAVIKPHFERLFNAFGDHTEVVYATGTADTQNIIAIAKDLKIAFAHKQRWLQDELNRINASIKGTKAIIKESESSRDALKKQIEKNKKDPKLMEEYRNTEIKIAENKEEYAELKEAAGLFGQLIAASVERLDAKKLNTLVKELTEELNEKNKQFKNFKGTNEEYEKLAREAKAVANLLRAAKKRFVELGNQELGKMVKSGAAQIEMFTHNVRTKPDIEKIIDRLVKIEYYSYIKDFGRKHNLTILREDLTLMHKKLNGFEFNLVLKGEASMGTSVRSYIKNSNTVVVDNFYNYIQTVGDSEVLKKPLTMLISGGHAFTSFSIEPALDLNSSNLLVSLAKGPFADRREFGEILNKKIVTRTTKIAEKLPIDSSASIVDIFPDGTVKHISLSSEFLKIKSVEADKRELKIANKLIRMEKSSNEAQKNGKDAELTEVEEGVKDKKLEKLILNQKLPSELKEYEVEKLSKKQILQLIPHAISSTPNNVRRLGIVAISDVHWGGWAEVDLLDKSIELGCKYIQQLENGRTPVLLLNGDLIEGNLANFKNAPAQRTLPNTYEDYRKFLERSGFSKEQINIELDKFSKNVSIIQTISAQAFSFIERLLSLIDEVIKRDGYIIIVSGNHFNGSKKGHEEDEATVLADLVKSYLKGKGFSDDKLNDMVKVVIGEEYGIGNIPVGMDGKNIIRVQHKLARVLEKKPDAIIKKRIPVAAVIESHYHEAKQTISGNLQTFETPSMQYEDENTYVSAFPQAISDATRGFMTVDLDLMDNKTIRSVFKPILRTNLERAGKLESPLYRAFRNETATVKDVHYKQKVA
jgi:hypothetical protein